MEENNRKSLEKKFRIKVPRSEINKKMEEDFLELSKNLKISGFRPGKVPIQFVKSKYGKEVLSKVTEKLIQQEGNKKFEIEGYRLASQPKVTLLSKINENSDLEAEFEFEILPKISVKDFKSLKLSKFVSAVESKDIDKVINNLFNDYKEYKEPETSRKSKNGDRMIISFKGFIDGKPFEGGSAEKQVIDLGSKNYFPEFEKNLTNKSKNDDVEFDMVFPENYNNEKLKGKKVKFSVIINNILEGIKLSNEDDLAKKTGSDNAKELRKKITAELEKYSEDLSFNMLKRNIVEQLNKSYSFPLPKTLVDREIESIKSSNKGKSDNGNIDKKFKENAENKVKIGLIISEIGIKNNINVNEKELETALARICMQYPGKEKEVIEHYKSNPAYMSSIKGPIFEDKVMKFISDNATITEKKISSDELLKKISELEKNRSLTKKKGKDEK